MRHPEFKHARWKTELRCVSGPRGVTVSTLDSESSDRGSDPREALCAGYSVNLLATTGVMSVHFERSWRHTASAQIEPRLMHETPRNRAMRDALAMVPHRCCGRRCW